MDLGWNIDDEGRGHFLDSRMLFSKRYMQHHLNKITIMNGYICMGYRISSEFSQWICLYPASAKSYPFLHNFRLSGFKVWMIRAWGKTWCGIRKTQKKILGPQTIGFPPQSGQYSIGFLGVSLTEFLLDIPKKSKKYGLSVWFLCNRG